MTEFIEDKEEGGREGLRHHVDSEGFPSRGIVGGLAGGGGMEGREGPSFRRWLIVTVQASDSEGSGIGWILKKMSTFLLIDF